jgi:hypothetical protein
MVLSMIIECNAKRLRHRSDVQTANFQFLAHPSAVKIGRKITCMSSFLDLRRYERTHQGSFRSFAYFVPELKKSTSDLNACRPQSIRPVNTVEGSRDVEESRGLELLPAAGMY